MTYDNWKCRSPDDEDPDMCIHEDYEADVNGRASCCQCGLVFYLTAADIECERRLSADYDDMMRREEWREWRADWVHRLAFWRRWRKPKAVDINDEIPF